MAAELTRRVHFAAAHRYRRPDWDDARNERVFGLCAGKNFHGHNYRCAVTVAGPIDPVTGMVVSLDVLDAVLQREVMDRFDHRNINLEVPEFADGRLVPTGENLARFILERVQGALGDAVRVTTVTVAEDESLSATVRAG
ncbi:MAG TPA: 6-carboxytetrahydropterin synthase [Gemmatimonadaceae bacterium]|nr:6-carboxytetrahydropterin synthase [Gemmatimonadaceae bacterium]